MGAPSIEALARIPEATLPSLLAYGLGPAPAGTDWTGRRPRWHDRGCKNSGYSAPYRACRRCAANSPAETYAELLGKLDKLAGNRAGGR